MKTTLKLLSITFTSAALLVVLSVASAFSATYYIDYASGSDGNSGTAKSSAWQRAPGMTGFSASYSHTAGDTFIFKGGVTWAPIAFPFNISYSGAAGKVDTYTTDHTWYNGSAWSQPVFNGGGNKNNLLTSSNKSYWKFDDIKIIGVGQAKVVNSSTMAYINGGSNFEISNNTFIPECWQTLYIINQTGGTQSGISVHHNDFSHAAVGVIGNTYGANSVIAGMQIYNNNFHDFSSQLIGTTHGDGIHLWSQVGEATNRLDGTKIYNNRFYGDWSYTSTSGSTGYIVLERNLPNTLIYNNVGSNSNPASGNFMASFITLWGNGTGAANYRVFNNSFSCASGGVGSAIWFTTAANITIQNNIFKGVGTAYYFNDTAAYSGLNIDYNDISTVSTISNYKGSSSSWSQWQLAGFDTHGTSQDPLFVSASTADLSLKAGSPAIGAGKNLSSVFNTDSNGNIRPLVWDIGAYQSGSTVTAKVLSPPVNLTVQ